jgi:RAD50-interacting protein 1
VFNIRIRFLVDIQTELLDAYAKRVESAVNAFESIGHSIMKAVPGAGAVADNKSTEGIDGLKRLCRWLNSARYVCAIIKEWGEDPVCTRLC